MDESLQPSTFGSSAIPELAEDEFVQVDSDVSHTEIMQQ